MEKQYQSSITQNDKITFLYSVPFKGYAAF